MLIPSGSTKKKKTKKKNPAASTTTTSSADDAGTAIRNLPVATSDQYCQTCNKTAELLLSEEGRDLMVCPKCRRQCYCSRDDFISDWKRHKLVSGGLKTERKTAKGIKKLHGKSVRDPKWKN